MPIPPRPPANTVPKDAARARNRIVVVRRAVRGPNRGRQNLLAGPPVTYARARRPQRERRNVGNECGNVPQPRSQLNVPTRQSLARVFRRYSNRFLLIEPSQLHPLGASIEGGDPRNNPNLRSNSRYRAPGKCLYVDARNFFLLFLNCTYCTYFFRAL